MFPKTVSGSPLQIAILEIESKFLGIKARPSVAPFLFVPRTAVCGALPRAERNRRAELIAMLEGWNGRTTSMQAPSVADGNGMVAQKVNRNHGHAK